MISHVRPIHARITFWVLLLGENLQLPFLAYHIFCFTFIAIVLYSVLKVPDLVPFGTKSSNIPCPILTIVLLPYGKTGDIC